MHGPPGPRLARLLPARAAVTCVLAVMCIAPRGAADADDPIRLEARDRYEAFLCSETMRSCLDVSEPACVESISKATRSCSVRRLSDAVASAGDLTAAVILEMHDASAEYGECVTRRFGEALGLAADSGLSCVTGSGRHPKR